MTAEQTATVERSLGRIEGRLDGLCSDIQATKNAVDKISTEGCAVFRGHKEIMAKMVEAANNNGNGHAKLEIGPLKISGVTATVLTRIVLILGIGYLIAKAHGWL